jgi:hypothetical protein
VAQDHNDIYSIVERLRILEEGLTPVNVKHGLNAQQKSVDQLSATFKPKTVAVLTAKKDPKNPMAGKLVGGCEESEELEEAVATEDVLEKVKKSLADYLSNVADEIKSDTDLKDKKKEDSDLKKKDKKDRDLVTKELDEDHQKLEVGDPITVTAPNEYEGKTGEIVEFSPSGKFVVVKLYNGDEASMHVSDIEYNEYADEQDVDDAWNDDEPMEIPVNEDPIEGDDTGDIAPEPVQNPVMPESVAVKTVTNECGLWEIHGNEPSGFEIRHGNNAMRSRFKSIDEAVMALEMFAARKKATDESQDYIEEA